RIAGRRSVCPRLGSLPAGLHQFFPRPQDTGRPGVAKDEEPNGDGDDPDGSGKGDRGGDAGIDGAAIEREVWHLAGILGVDPGPFTLRALSLMGRGRRGDSWSRWA